MSSLAGYDLSNASQVRDVLRMLLADPTLYPEEFISWIPNHIGSNFPDVPIDQLVGYQSQVPQFGNLVTAEESRGGIAYADLTTPGPQLSHLEDGLYLITWSAGSSVNDSTTRSKMSISVNGAPPDDTTIAQAYTASPNVVGVSSHAVIRLNAGISGNALKCQYATGKSTATGLWGQRTMHAVKVSQ